MYVGVSPAASEDTFLRDFSRRRGREMARFAAAAAAPPLLTSGQTPPSCAAGMCRQDLCPSGIHTGSACSSSLPLSFLCLSPLSQSAHSDAALKAGSTHGFIIIFNAHTPRFTHATSSGARPPDPRCTSLRTVLRLLRDDFRLLPVRFIPSAPLLADFSGLGAAELRTPGSLLGMNASTSLLFRDFP